MMRKIVNTAFVTLAFSMLVVVAAYAQTTFTFPESPSGMLFGAQGTSTNTFGQPTNQFGTTATDLNNQPESPSTGAAGAFTPGRVYSGGMTGSLYDPGILTNQYGGYGGGSQIGGQFTLPSTRFEIRNEQNTFGRTESTSPFTASPVRPFTPPETSSFGSPLTSPFGTGSGF